MDEVQDSDSSCSTLENGVAKSSKRANEDSTFGIRFPQSNVSSNMQSLPSTSCSLPVATIGAFKKVKKKSTPKKTPKKTARKKKPERSRRMVDLKLGGLQNKPEMSYCIDSSDEEVKDKSEPDPDYVPTTSRSYNKMTSKELDSIAKRIRVYRDTGVVVSDDDVTTLCHNTKKKQEPGGNNRHGPVGIPWTSTYDASRCTCCNVLKDRCNMKDSTVSENGAANTMYTGLLSMMSKNMAQRYKKQEEQRLRLQTRELLKHPEITGCQGSKDELENETLPPPPELTPAKREWVQRFIDSMAAERIDYEKPKLKNMIEGLSHVVVSEQPCSTTSMVDASTIKERIDFQKEMERRSRLCQPKLDQWLTNGSSSTSVAVSPPQFSINELHATSTPKFMPDPAYLVEPTPATSLSHFRPLSATMINNEGKVYEAARALSPNNSTYNALLTQPGCSKSISNWPSVPSFELQADLSCDLSHLDRSNITLRTPHSKSATKFRRSSLDADQESNILTFIDRLLVSEQDDIKREAQERCDRLVQTTDQTHNALHTALDNILIPDDDMANDHIMLEDSVHIIDDSLSTSPNPPTVLSNDSVQLIDTDIITITDSEVQFVADPPTPRLLRKRKGRPAESNKPSRKRLKNPPSATCTSAAGTSAAPAQRDKDKPTTGLQDCPICLEKLGRKEISSTICGHVYCTPCIRAAVKAQRCCPNCRMALTLKKIHPLFI